MTHLSKHDYQIVPVSQAEANTLVAAYHYSGGAGKTAVHRHGLLHIGRNELVGVAIWLPPIRAAAVKVNRHNPNKVLALSRLVIAPDEPTNAASFLLGRSIRLIRQEGKWKSLVTYADARMEHTGQIYRATNWQDDGDTGRYYAWLDENGKQVCKKATINRTSAFMDEHYERVGPFSKRRFIMHLT